MKRIVIVGGVAAGASAAARARRLDENAVITVIERGKYTSFANCGLPYHLSGVIANREDLIVQTPESLKARLNIDVLIHHEALAIDRNAKRLKVRDLSSGREFFIEYDSLILATGAEVFKPPIKGLDTQGVFTFLTIPDMDAVIEHLKKANPHHVTVIGGGFIGLEVAENLKTRGLAITLVEASAQVMPPIDLEMASLLHHHIKKHEIDLRLGSGVSEISRGSDRITITLGGHSQFQTDLVIFAAGVRSAIGLADNAGLEIGKLRGVKVDKQLRTSDDDIYAAGDLIETCNRMNGEPMKLPLAGPANAQGRIAADNAVRGCGVSYRGAMGTWVCKVFDLTCAQTGYSEKILKSSGMNHSKIYLHPYDHAGYYPDAKQMSMKLLYENSTGRILGAQIIGRTGVDKRIDIIATAIAGKMTVEDLVHLELAYAPPYGSAKDPINLAGMIAQNLRTGLHRGIHVDEFDRLASENALILDTRTADEYNDGHIPGAVRIDIDELRERLEELPRNRRIIIYCLTGLRGYFADRILAQRGFDAANLIGGLQTWRMYHPEVLG